MIFLQINIHDNFVDFIAELVDFKHTKFIYILFKTRVIKDIWKRTSANYQCIGADRGVAAVRCVGRVEGRLWAIRRSR